MSENKNTGGIASFDGLANILTGMGTDRDRRMFNRFEYSPIQNFGELEAAYCENWIARVIVDIPVDDATREWRTFNSKEAGKIAEVEKAYGVKRVTQEAFKWSGLYGGAGVLMLTDQDLKKPLKMEKIGRGSLKRLLTLDRMLLTGRAFNMLNPLTEDYMMPEYYSVAGGTQYIHHTHFIRAPGAVLPMRLRMINGGWDDSHLRRCLEDIKDSVAAKGGIASLISEANIDIITKKGLANDLSSGDMDEAIKERYRIFGLMKSLFRLALLDGEETFDRKQISFGGLGDILSTLMEWTSGASGIPMTRIFGVQSKGLGDSGQGDMNNYNNRIRGEQESHYQPFLQRLDEVVIRSTLGGMPDDPSFTFNPLSQPTDIENAQRELADAQTDDLRMAQGVVKRSQVVRKLKEQGVYAITDEDIARIEADEKSEREGEYQFQLGQSSGNDPERLKEPQPFG
ncbi:DUF1073 domain-containing protein [Pluralibacter gergoviae]|uniref:DUF1073 domain-containing protein n=1 Tax=Pluralibacter gergoviae TaxID=61647 RepID=A0AAI9DLA6_PLUGE|nr:DUF1073 domain-containing protein [Pluralibacter gergoviae]EKV9907725.1 DUF1073 domain-containing protein [Pluralibacter gergoviae]EKW7276806.1 DUF1073 domain-containing protein [Pluralibacter gergoviae]ELD4293943.1 DUF1073 domain-containing protein [Pluralibacter gergoviae]ELD4304722.1 DUF1073 domain-containing protein [Pluralibacter gergoviae]